MGLEGKLEKRVAKGKIAGARKTVLSFERGSRSEKDVGSQEKQGFERFQKHEWIMD